MSTDPPSPRATPATVEPPTPSALLLCEDVTQSMVHGRYTLHGVIDRIVVRALPVVVGPFVAFIRWSNVYAGQQVVFTFGRDGSDVVAFRAKLASPMASNPLHTHTITPVVPRFEIAEAGRFLLQATHGGMPFAQSPVTVELARPDRLG